MQESVLRNCALVPFLILFFGAIFLMGTHVSMNRILWSITAASTVVHLTSMGWEMRYGVG